MRGLIKLGFYAAAVYGTYELARRYGLIEKAAAFLEEQIPEEYKERARQMSEQVREQAHQYVDTAKERVSEVGDRVMGKAEQAVDRLGGARSESGSANTSTGNTM